MTATTRKNFAKRLNEALSKLHDCPEEHTPGRAKYLSLLFKVSHQNAHRWLKGEHMPESTRLEEVSNCLGVRIEWLMTGKGLMVNESVGDDIDYVIEGTEALQQYFEWREATYRETFKAGNRFEPEFEAELCRTVCYLLNTGLKIEDLNSRAMEHTVAGRRKRLLGVVK